MRPSTVRVLAPSRLLRHRRCRDADAPCIRRRRRTLRRVGRHRRPRLDNRRGLRPVRAGCVPRPGGSALMTTRVPAIAYAAKSSTDEKESLRSQLARIREKAEAERRTVVAGYSDEDASGYSKSESPAGTVGGVSGLVAV